MNRIYPKFTGNVVPCNLPQSCSETEGKWHPTYTGGLSEGWEMHAQLTAENRRRWRRIRRLACAAYGPTIAGVVLGISAAYVVVCLLRAYTVWLGA